MATAAVAIEDLKTGSLPPVCAKTGAEADGEARLEFTTTPSWTGILLLFGILPFLIARSAGRTRVNALLPFSDGALRRGRMFNWAVRILLPVGVGLLIWGSAAGPAAAWAGLSVFLAGLLVLVFGWPFFWPTGQVEGDWVRLGSSTHASPANWDASTELVPQPVGLLPEAESR
ncbi:MAG TPA: hypothetical protein VGR13_00055 [Actinomycetota bacterium]|nr:hypothetical protein [Actinomycetota bacterium]